MCVRCALCILFCYCLVVAVSVRVCCALPTLGFWFGLTQCVCVFCFCLNFAASFNVSVVLLACALVCSLSLFCYHLWLSDAADPSCGACSVLFAK